MSFFHRAADFAAGRAGETRGRRGQALIESCMVILLICLMTFGLLQVSRFFTAREILDFAAARGARARTVGFNRFMLFKAVRVATIPSAGRLRFPEVEGGLATQQAIEEARIPFYLGAEHPSLLPAVLDYEFWPDIDFAYRETAFGGQVDFRTRQRVPFSFPLHRLYYAGDALDIEGQASLENHAGMYLRNLEF